jgi:RimJ/RimL family protein N-acetyltransferase
MDSTPTAFIAARTHSVVLPDGTPLRVRPILPDDKLLLLRAFDRLSPESRYARFFSPMPRLSAPLLDYFTEVDYHNHFAWVALAREADEDVGVGVARYVRLPDSSVAEAAVTVVDTYQRRGIGGFLLDALILEALAHGISRFEGLVLVGNTSMIAVLLRARARITRDRPGMLCFEIDLPARSRELRLSPVYDVLRAFARGEG